MLHVADGVNASEGNQVCTFFRDGEWRIFGPSPGIDSILGFCDPYDRAGSGELERGGGGNEKFVIRPFEVGVTNVYAGTGR